MQMRDLFLYLSSTTNSLLNSMHLSSIFLWFWCWSIDFNSFWKHLDFLSLILLRNIKLNSSKRLSQMKNNKNLIQNPHKHQDYAYAYDIIYCLRLNPKNQNLLQLQYANVQEVQHLNADSKMQTFFQVQAKSYYINILHKKQFLLNLHHFPP